MRFSKNNIKIFFCSLAGTFLLLTLLCGFILVEKNTRYIAFGDNTPFFVYQQEKNMPYFVRLHFMGSDYVILASEKNQN